MQDSSELAQVWEMGMRGCYCEKDALQSAGAAGYLWPSIKHSLHLAISKAEPEPYRPAVLSRCPSVTAHLYHEQCSLGLFVG